MPLWFFLVVVLVPLIDLFVLVRIGGFLGLWMTVFLVICTSVAGLALARWQGLRSLVAIRADLAEGRMPADRLADGALLMLAALLLLVPGFLTDIPALVLLVPPIRRWCRRGLGRYLRARGVITMVVSRSDGVNCESGEAVIYEAGAELPRPAKYVQNEAGR